MNEKDFRTKYYDRAKKLKPRELAGFIDEMMKESLDYGSICCCVAAAALGAANSVNHHEKGGITGFQAGAVMWEFVRQWNYSSNELGLAIIDYDNLFYSQYADKFGKRPISQEQFDKLQAKAKKALADDVRAGVQHKTDMLQYEKDVAEYITKHPDYHDRPEHYDHLGCGNSDDWAAYYKKKEDGFDFAPKKPYYHKPEGQIPHWLSIVNGVVPFGLTIGDD